MILGLLLPAWALDGTGARPTPQEGALTDPLVALHPVRPQAEQADVRLTAELAGRSFVLDVEDAGETTEYALLDGLFGLHLAGTASFGPRISVGVGLPIWLGSQGALGGGGGLGDLRLQAPVALVRPGADGAGFGVSVVPWLDAPTGDATRFLGRGGFGGGALGVAGYGLGPVRLSLNAGVAGAASQPMFGVDERARFLFGGATSWAISERYGLTVESTLEKPLVGPLAGEVRLLGRTRLPVGLELTGGAATAVANGVGSANLRLFLGAGYRFGKRTPAAAPIAAVAEVPATPFDVYVRAVDEIGRPLADATVSATQGEDRRVAPVQDGDARLTLASGTWEVRIEAPGRAAQARTLALEPDRFRPAELDAVLPTVTGDAALALRFEDAEGRPVEDARVRVDGDDRGRTGPGGTFVLEGVAPGEREVRVEAPGFLERAAVNVPATPDAAARVVVMERPRGAVRLRIRGPEGVVDDAVVRFDGPEALAPAPVGPTGEKELVLAPGRWRVAISSAGFGLQTREIVVDPSSAELVVVDVILAAVGGDAALGVRVVDPDGRPVEDAEVLLDGKPAGRTSNGGAFAVEGLAEGARRLEVRGARFRPLPPREVELVSGWRDLLVQLEWLPGTVEVLARGPDGPVADAAVRFGGPATIGPTALGPDGHAFFSLAPGAWVAALSSPSFGIQARELTVSPDETSLLVVDATLRADEAGTAALTVRARDPDGAPVEGATVRVDGLVVGTTSTGGSLRLEGLQPGRRAVSVSADLYEDATLPPVGIRAGDNEAVAKLRWVPGMVHVRAVGPDGQPVDALARFYGVEGLPPLPLGPDGARSFALAPGKWTAVLSSERYGLAQEQILVAPKNATELTMRLAPSAVATAKLLVEVVDTDGAPVPGATLRLGDTEHVLPSGAGVLDGLAVGTKPGRVTAEGYAPVDLGKVALVGGAQERRIVLVATPRPLRVVVRGAGGAAVPAEVRLVGPSRVPAASTAAGVAEARVRPGAWQVLVSAEGYGAERRDVVVAPGAEPVVVEVALAGSRVEVTATAVLLRQQVRFRFNEAVLEPESYRVLDELAATLRTDARVTRVEIQGHTDAVGTEEYNVALSQRRADAVRDYLTSRGVDGARLVAKGYGTSRPQAANDTEAGRARNRRVQFEFVAE